jgi:hypothetical protein
MPQSKLRCTSACGKDLYEVLNYKSTTIFKKNAFFLHCSKNHTKTT